MDWQPIHALKIIKQSNKSSKYELNSEELEKLLIPLNDIEVAVIPIVGQPITGKSFFVNHMCLHLSESQTNDLLRGMLY